MPRPGNAKHMAKMSRRAQEANRRRIEHGYETMEEIEALIQEQLKPENLPSWWYEDFNTNGDVIGSVKVDFKPKKDSSYYRKKKGKR